MKTENWIDIRDRKPGAQDLPLVMGGFSSDLGWVTTSLISAMNHVVFTGEPWTHWTPLKAPPPPVKEPTRDEQDEKLIDQIQEAFMADKSLLGRKHLIALALSYERSEIRHLIQRHRCGEIPAPELIREISKRVKLT